MKNIYLRTLLALGFIMFLFNSSDAQDIIRRIDGKTIECKIIKLSDDEIIYYPYGLEDPPEISIRMNLVKKVTFETGYSYEKSNIREAEVFLYEETYRNILKIDLFSSIGGTTKLTYERLRDHRNSFEIGLLIHGIGMNNIAHAAGLGVEVGHKFLLSTSNIFTNSDRKNALSGFYIKPEALLGHVSYIHENYSYGSNSWKETRLNETYFGLFLNAGAQLIINDVFAIDLYFGVGPTYYPEKYKKLDNSDSYYEVQTLPVGGGNWVNSSNFGAKGGIKIGYAFGDKLDAKRIIRSK